MADLGRLKIGDFVLDPARNLLIGAGEETGTGLEPKVVDVLLALAAKPGAVMTRDELIEVVWKTEFGADERLTRTISQLRKAFGDERGAARYIETVSKRGYRLVATVGKITEEVPARPQDLLPVPTPATNGALSPATPAAAGASTAEAAFAERTEPPRHAPVRWWQSWRALAGGAAALLALVAVSGWAWRSSETTAIPHADGVIELRPFVVIGNDPAMDTFARQTHVTLKRMLASNQLRVVERDAAALPPATRNASEFLLSGMIEKTGSSYTVTLYFDNRADGQTLWSQSLTRAVADEAALREAVGAVAAHTMGCGLRQRAKAPRKPSMQAFMIYLELCDWKIWDDNGATVLAAAQRLVAIVPDDAYGHGLAAFANGIMAADRPEGTPAQIEAHAGAARKAAARALQLDPKNEDALLAISLLGSRVQHWLGLDALRKRHASFNDAWSLRLTGRLQESIHVLDQRVAAEPLSLEVRTYRAALIMQAGYHEAAARILAEVLRLQSDQRAARFYRFVNTAFYGPPERALALLEDDADFLEIEASYRACWRAFLEARSQPGDHGRKAATVRAACDEFYQITNDSHRDYVRRMLAALGDVDGVFELVRTTSWAWTGSTTLLWYPEMAAVRRDARFMPLIVPSGLPEYWLKSENWPDFCRNDVLPYDCKSAAAQALKGGVAVTSGR